jgi:hypothetical protein
MTYGLCASEGSRRTAGEVQQGRIAGMEGRPSANDLEGDWVRGRQWQQALYYYYHPGRTTKIELIVASSQDFHESGRQSPIPKILQLVPAKQEADGRGDKRLSRFLGGG